jgi:hypothetical protein
VHEAEREQPAIELAEDLVVVEEGEHRPDRLAADLGKHGQLWHDDVSKLVGDVPCFVRL